MSVLRPTEGVARHESIEGVREGSRGVGCTDGPGTGPAGPFLIDGSRPAGGEDGDRPTARNLARRREGCD